MYLDFYGLKKNPFSISPDPAFLWFGPKHQKAFAVLRYGILEEKGFLCLTGEVGTGKTVLIRNLINTIEVPTIIISVPDPDMKPFEFFRYVAREIKIKGKFRSKADFLMQFQIHVNAAFGSDTRVLMILDEAQRLNFALLEQVRLLSNIVSTKERHLNIFLVGQLELNDLLSDDRARATQQRIVIRHKLEPLTLGEVTAYIYHRMQVAGSDRVIFIPDAIEAVALQTNGIPRAINVICDQALLRGFKENATVIDAEIVNSCPAAKEVPQATLETEETESASDNLRRGEDPDQGAIPAGTPPTTGPQQLRQAIVATLTVAFLLAGFGAFYYFFLDKGISDRQEMRESTPKIFLGESVRPEQFAVSKRVKSGPAANTEAAVRLGKQEEVRREKKLPEAVDKRKAASEAEIKTQTAPVQHAKSAGSTKEMPVRSDADGEVARKEASTASASEGEAASTDRFADQAAQSQKRPSKLILYFKFDSTKLTAESANDLRQFISDISTDSEATFMVAGYTDSIGDYWYNKKLSQRRANAVRDLLIEGGVKRANIFSMGMGSKDLQAGREPKYDPRKDRRVEVFLKGVR